MDNLPDSLKNLIISPQEYAERQLSQLCPTLDVYQNEHQAFYYLGIAHSHELEHHQWKFIEAQWKHFLAHTGKLRVAFTEGWIAKPSSSMQESISRDGEVGMVTYLASKQSIRVFSLEPSIKQQYENLQPNYSDEEILFFFFLRLVAARKHRQPQMPPLRDFIEPVLESYRHAIPDKATILNFDYLLGLSETVLGYPFPGNIDQLWQLNSIVRTEAITNRIAMANSVFRNQHIVSEIIRVWQHGNSMFAVYGAAHPVVQEPALRVALQ